MGIEGGPSGGGIVISSGPSIGVGGLESFGAKMTAPFSSPVSEGPAGGSFLENNMPHTFNDPNIIIGRNRFNLAVELNSPETEVPAVFQSGLSDINLDPGINPEVAIVEPAIFPLPGIKAVIEPVVPQINPRITPWMEYVPIPVNKPAVRPDIDIASESEIKTENTLVTQPVVENRTSPKINLVSPVRAVQEQLVEEVVEEVELNAPEVIEVHTQEAEKVDRTKALHVIDKKGVVKRIVHTVAVLVGALQIKKGAKEKRLPISIKGSEAVAQLLPSNKSEIRGGEINSKDPEEKLPDKTWDATLERLEQLEFATKEQIIRQVPKIVEENHPVALAIAGEVASEKNILRSHEHIKGSSHAHLEFEKRTQLRRKQVTRTAELEYLN